MNTCLVHCVSLSFSACQRYVVITPSREHNDMETISDVQKDFARDANE